MARELAVTANGRAAAAGLLGHISRSQERGRAIGDWVFVRGPRHRLHADESRLASYLARCRLLTAERELQHQNRREGTAVLAGIEGADLRVGDVEEGIADDCAGGGPA